MAGLNVVAWFWGTKYPLSHVEKLVCSVRRNLSTPHRFLVVTDDIYREGLADLDSKIEIVPIIRSAHLLAIKGCFARLQMFNPSWQYSAGIAPGERIVSLDLDVVVTRKLNPLFDGDEKFLILKGANASNPCPYNGSIFSFIAGEHADVWSDFSLEAAEKIRYYEFPDDQGWLAHKIPGATGWDVGLPSDIYAFQKPGWPKNNRLPKGARLIVFPGWRDPEKFAHLDWVKEHWKC